MDAVAEKKNETFSENVSAVLLTGGQRLIALRDATSAVGLTTVVDLLHRAGMVGENFREMYAPTMWREWLKANDNGEGEAFKKVEGNRLMAFDVVTQQLEVMSKNLDLIGMRGLAEQLEEIVRSFKGVMELVRVRRLEESGLI